MMAAATNPRSLRALSTSSRIGLTSHASAADADAVEHHRRRARRQSRPGAGRRSGEDGAVGPSAARGGPIASGMRGVPRRRMRHDRLEVAQPRPPAELGLGAGAGGIERRGIAVAPRRRRPAAPARRRRARPCRSLPSPTTDGRCRRCTASRRRPPRAPPAPSRARRPGRPRGRSRAGRCRRASDSPGRRPSAPGRRAPPRSASGMRWISGS